MIRDIFSNNSVFYDVDTASDPSFNFPITSATINLSSGTTLTSLLVVTGDIESGTGAFEIYMTPHYFTDISLATEVFDVIDPVTGVSPLGNKVILADGSPMLAAVGITGNFDDMSSGFLVVVNPPEDAHFMTIEYTDIATLDSDVSLMPITYRGNVKLIEPGVSPTFLDCNLA